MEPLEERVCLVTGAGHGIGRAIAVELAAQGAAGVAIADVDADAGTATCGLVREAGSDSLFVHCDLRDLAEIEAAVALAVGRFGRLDVLVNNAGIIESSLVSETAFDEIPEDVWDAVQDVNVKAVWRMTRAAAPHLRRSSLTPAVVNTASTASFVGYAHPAYCASKGAVLQLTRAMAIDLAPEVRCNCFCPGSTDTRLYRDGSEPGMPAGAESAMARTSLIPRPGEPGEVAKVAAFLASKDALFVTGAAYVVDGGSLAWRGTR